jgi:hypothetical protein
MGQYSPVDISVFDTGRYARLPGDQARDASAAAPEASVKDVTPMRIAARRKTAHHRAAARADMVAAISFAFAFTLASPAALGQSAASTPATRAPASSVQGYGDHDKTCTSWTDGCVSCQTGTNNAVACSNTGIACQPQAIACLVRRKEPAAEPAK